MNLFDKSTTYEDILKRAPEEYCRRIARRIGLPDRLPASQLPQQISQRLLKPKVLKAIIERLTPYERSVLTMLTFSCDEKGVALELLNQKLTQICRKWPYTSQQIQQTLSELGFVFIMTIGNFRYFCAIPEQIRMLLLEVFATDVRKALKSPDPAPRSIRNDGLALIRDIFTFLSFSTQNDVKTTQQHTIYKRVQQRIFSHFEVAEDTPKVYDRINPVEGGTDRLAFIFRFCSRRKLIDRADSTIRCNASGKAWIQKSDAEKVADVYAFWREAYTPNELPTRIGLSILHILPSNHWVLLSSIAEQVNKFSVVERWPQTLYSVLERQFVNHLTYMGCIGISFLDGDVAIQITDMGRRVVFEEPIESYEPEASFITQPNFEILASSYLAPDIRWTLDLIGEVHQADQVVTYKLTSESIYNALRSDMSLDDILEFLDTHSKTGIPQNVELSIKEWAQRYGQVYFMDVMLLRCKSQRIADELKASKSTNKYILGEISPTDLIVDRRRVKELSQFLEKQNYMPLPDVVTLEDE